ncbi:MAG: ABC transporter ATP-binding protein [Clostridiales bacterium]|nr:ABC transporter ATP-binding protein [Clostridiales bacterium]
MEKPIISLENVNKEYRKYTSNHQRLWHEIFWQNTGILEKALDDISFSIGKGEKVALIGREGAGKTTIMSLIAKIIKPTSGKVRVRANPTLILDHRIGFDGGMTGRDNLYLKAALMGWSREKTRRLEPEIIEFADLKELIDQPVKIWKPGTLTRLGFTMNTIEKPDLLLIDEVFNVGPSYLPKCVDRLKNLVEGDTTFLMTVGNYNVAKKICERGIVVDQGKICFDGPLDEAITFYRANCKIDLTKQTKLKLSAEPEEEEIMEDEADFNDYG